MTSPFISGPGVCNGVGCSPGRDAWILHHVRLNGDFYRLCSACVLLHYPAAFCSACLLLLSPDTSAAVSQEPHLDPNLFPPDPIAVCSHCGVCVAHLSCIRYLSSFVCPRCAAAANRRPFSYDLAGGDRGALDERAARVFLAAARLSHESVLRAATEACEKAESSGREAATARKRSRDMLDAASRAMEAEASDAKKPATPAASEQPKKKTPKRSEASRDRDKLLNLKAMQQPTLAFAATAAAAASSMPLSIPSSRKTKKATKQGARGEKT